MSYGDALTKLGVRKHFILNNPLVKRWHTALSKGSILTADGVVRRLALYCSRTGMTPDELLDFSPEEAHSRLEEFVESLEEEKMPSYVVTLEKAIRNFYAFNGVTIPRIRHNRKLGDRLIEAKGLEKVPSHDELGKVIRDSTSRVRTMVVLMAHSGIRPGVLGDITGQYGLRLQDLPELTITKEGASFTEQPTMILVPASLSKTHKPYVTFLSVEGCGIVADYLNDRIKRGEELCPGSPLIRTIPSPKGKGSFCSTKTIGADIRRCFRKTGLNNSRPYSLRVFFSQCLQSSEARGYLTHSQSQLFMGHKGDMISHYQFNGKALSPEILDELRAAYKRSEELLMISAPRTSPEMIRMEVRKALLQARISMKLSEKGIPEPEINKFIERNRLLIRTDEEVDTLIEEKFPSPATDPGGCPGCNGVGLQVNRDGLKVLCPICSGTGRWDGMSE